VWDFCLLKMHEGVRVALLTPLSVLKTCKKKNSLFSSSPPWLARCKFLDWFPFSSSAAFLLNMNLGPTTRVSRLYIKTGLSPGTREAVPSSSNTNDIYIENLNWTAAGGSNNNYSYKQAATLPIGFFKKRQVAATDDCGWHFERVHLKCSKS